MNQFLLDLDILEEADLVDSPGLIQDHEACAVYLPTVVQDITSVHVYTSEILCTAETTTNACCPCITD